MTLIAEDLLLLLLDDEDGTLVQQSFVDQALAGAVLAELADAGHVRLRERRWGAKPLLERAPVPGPDDPLLAAALEVVAERARTAQALLGPLRRVPTGTGLRTALLERLAERGLVRREEGRVLGLFPRTTWPALDSAHEDAVRDDLAATLLEGETPAARTVALVGLLHAIGRAHKVVGTGAMSAGEVKRRAKAVAEGELASEALTDAVQAVYTAIFVAAVVPAATGGG